MTLCICSQTTYRRWWPRSTTVTDDGRREHQRQSTGPRPVRPAASIRPRERRMSSAAELSSPAEGPGRSSHRAVGDEADEAQVTAEVRAAGQLLRAEQLTVTDQPADRPYPGGIPEATVARLPIYLRAL